MYRSRLVAPVTVAVRLKPSSITGEDGTDEAGKCNEEQDANDETGNDKEDDIMAIMTWTMIMTKYVLNPVEN
jgi:hypothetical protein